MILSNTPGWTRIAIVISASWIVIILGYTLFEYFISDAFGYLNYDLYFLAWKQPAHSNYIALTLNNSTFWPTMFIPIAAIWTGIYALVPAIAWIKRGFKS